MPAYNADIIVNTRLQNQKSLSLAVSSVQKLARDAAAIKPINLFAPGAGAKASAIGKELEKIKKVARAINRGETGPGKLSSTFAGASDQARILSDVLANVNLNAKNASASIDIFAEAFARAELKAENLRQTFEETLNTARQAEASRTGDFSVALNPAVQAALSPSKVPEQLKRENDQINAVLDARAELFETNKREVRQITENFFSLSSIEDKVRDENRQINRALDERAELFEKNRQEIRKIEADYFSLQSQEQRAETAFAGPFGISSADVNKQLDDRAKLINDAIDKAAEAEIASRKEVAQAAENLQKELTNLNTKSIEDETSRKVKLQDEAARKDLQARKDVNDKALRDFDTKLDKRVAARRRRERFGEDLLLGAGFPLLFGGGVGAVGGGLLGAAIGGGKGGFGAQIFFSAIGTQLDAFVQKARELGRALNDPTENLDALIDSLGTTGAKSKDLIGSLRALGLEEVAAATAVDLLTAKLATLGIDAEQFKNETAQLDNAIKDLQLVFTALAAQLVPVLNKITQIVGGFVGTTADKSGLSATGAVQGSAEATLSIQRAEQARKDTLNQALLIEKQITNIKQQSNQLTASERAELEFYVQAQKNSAKLAKLRLRYSAEESVFKKDLLKNEILLTQEKRKQLIAERAAAAERNIKERVKTVQDEITRARGLGVESAKLDADILGLFLPPQEAIASRIKAIYKEVEAGRERIQLEIQRIEQDSEIFPEVAKARIDTLNKELALLEKRGAFEIKQQQNLEKRLQIEKELAAFQREVAQRLQIEEAQQATGRAGLELANPFGGADYEQELQRLDQFVEKQQLLVDQALVLKRLETQKKDPTADTAEIQRQIDQQKLVNQAVLAEVDARQEVERQILRQQQVLETLQPYTDAAAAGLTDLFTSVVDGSKTATEAFADFLKNISNILAQSAAQIIAQYIAIGIARAFAGIPQAEVKTSSLDFSSAFADPGFTQGILPQFANGGNPPVGKPSIVGERGPELFVPRTSGTIVPNNQLGGATNIVVNVDAKGSNAQGGDQQGKQLGQAIGAAVQAELIKQKRPGGLLS